MNTRGLPASGVSAWDQSTANTKPAQRMEVGQ